MQTGSRAEETTISASIIDHEDFLANIVSQCSLLEGIISA